MSGNKYRVLLVEDSAPDARYFRALLEADRRPSFIVVTVPRLQAALEALREAPAFDAVLLDLTLPDAQGLEALLAIRCQSPELPVVVLTGREANELGSAAVRAGAQDFLEKGRIEPALLGRSLSYAIDRRRLEARLREAQRLEAVGRLVGGLAHDFNNLLAVISIHAGLLQEGLSGHPELSEHSKQIIQAHEAAAALTEQLLAISRNQILSMAPFDLNPLVEEVRQMMATTLPPGIEWTTEISAELAPILADRTQMAQVVLNLVLNALDAMPRGGRLTIGTKLVERAPAIMHSLLEPPAELRPGGATPEPGPEEAAAPGPAGDAATCVLLSVADTGGGIPDEIRAHIFDPFFTTKGRHGRSGLGLATVYTAVQQCGGWIELTSYPGRGTRFDLYFPAVGAATATGWPAGAAPATVLLALDSLALREAFGEVLHARNYYVETAPTLEVGLQRALEQPGSFDVVVAEMPPADDEADVAAKLRRLPDLPILWLAPGPVSPRHPLLSSPLRRSLPRPVQAPTLLQALAALKTRRPIPVRVTAQGQRS